MDQLLSFVVFVIHFCWHSSLLLWLGFVPYAWHISSLNELLYITRIRICFLQPRRSIPFSIGYWNFVPQSYQVRRTLFQQIFNRLLSPMHWICPWTAVLKCSFTYKFSAACQYNVSSLSGFTLKTITYDRFYVVNALDLPSTPMLLNWRMLYTTHPCQLVLLHS